MFTKRNCYKDTENPVLSFFKEIAKTLGGKMPLHDFYRC